VSVIERRTGDRKEVNDKMREVCYCGRSGELEDREPILESSGRWVLRCPECGHLDDLAWLSEGEGLLLWGEARYRREGPFGRRPAA
jgi:hypothetical protein